MPNDVAAEADEHCGVVGGELDRLLELGDRLVAAPGELVDLGEHRPVEPAGYGLAVAERLDQFEGLVESVQAGQRLRLAKRDFVGRHLESDTVGSPKALFPPAPEECVEHPLVPRPRATAEE